MLGLVLVKKIKLIALPHFYIPLSFSFGFFFFHLYVRMLPLKKQKKSLDNVCIHSEISTCEKEIAVKVNHLSLDMKLKPLTIFEGCKFEIHIILLKNHIAFHSF